MVISTWRLWLAAMVALLLFTAACDSDSDSNSNTNAAANPSSSTSTSTSPSPSTSAGGEGETVTLGSITYNNHGTEDVQGKSEVEFEADNFYFGPTFLRGEPGQTLTLEIENESSAMHSFTVPDQQIDQRIDPNSKVNVTITFPQSGAVRFLCTFHTSQGMNGQLLVGDASPQPLS